MAREVVAVVGAAGGVGASTLAALLARHSAARGAGTVLVDLDLWRGGIEVLLGIEAVPGVRWPDLKQVRGRLAAADLEGVLPRWGRVEVLSATRPASLLEPAAVEAVWASLVAARGTIVVDLPAEAVLGSAPGAGEVLASRPEVLLTTGQDVLGVAGALAAANHLVSLRTQLVLRRRRRARVAPLEAAHLLGLPVAGLLPEDRRVAEAVDRGFGPAISGRSALARAVARVAAGVGG